ncbi:MAG: methyltransferase, TIGR04325 family [Bacteroidales bacterium]|nr:MAG: methyltransferase, TIGR04325 family [Bacteroidales bacterium]
MNFSGIIRRIKTFLFYGWKGNYISWEEAERDSDGYGSDSILQKVKEATEKVRDGTAAYERDSVLFDEIQYSYPFLATLMFVAAKNKGKLNVLDFGGSLGSSYYQHLRFLQHLDDFHWNIVEQPHFVKEGLHSFETDHLHFFYTIKDCIKKCNINLALFSGVLQYLKEPYKILDEVFDHQIEYILIDRTPFQKKGKDRITIQKVPKWIYEASYPCWFFNEQNFKDKMESGYEMIYEFEALDRARIPSKFKGFFYRKK